MAEDLDHLAIPSRGARPYCRFMHITPLGFLLITAMVWYVKMWIQLDRSRWQVRTPAIGFTPRKSIRLGNLGARAAGVNGLWLCGRVSASATRAEALISAISNHGWRLSDFSDKVRFPMAESHHCRY